MLLSPLKSCPSVAGFDCLMSHKLSISFKPNVVKESRKSHVEFRKNAPSRGVYSSSLSDGYSAIVTDVTESLTFVHLSLSSFRRGRATAHRNESPISKPTHSVWTFFLAKLLFL